MEQTLKPAALAKFAVSSVEDESTISTSSGAAQVRRAEENLGQSKAAFSVGTIIFRISKSVIRHDYGVC